MNPCIKEIIELAFKATSGTVMTRIKPNAIIIEEEILTNHFVIGSNSISKNQKTNIPFFYLLSCLIATHFVKL
tara:strand:+ start:440 stop:658 length:219 start_codon:yes stop_codon:yes gene_type:complete